MTSKKKLIIGAAVVVVLIAGAVLWKGGFLGQGVGVVSPGLGVLLSNKMTDAIYLEAMTAIAQNTIKNYTANSSTLTQEEVLNETKKIYSEIFVKYGISEEEFGRYSQALNEDKVRSAAMQEKLQQIMSDLFNAKK